MAVVQGLVLAAGGFALGAACLLYLTVHPLKVDRYLLAASLLAFLAISGVLVWFDGWQRLAGAAAVALAALAGYWWMTGRFLAREDERPVPPLTRQKGDPGQGHTAVVYFTHGEPETYDPIGWINQFREFDEQGIPFVPLLARPFFVYNLRRKYLTVGRSNHRSTHMRMLRRLEEAYRAEGDASTRFYLSFLDDAPRPDAAVVQALNDGASQVVVAEVFLTISNHTAEGKSLIEELDLGGYDVPIRYTGPLWDSDLLQRVFVVRANRHLNGTGKAETGVLLVGHGQPDEWDREWPTETEQELSFRRAVLQRFAEDGYEPSRLSLAWMEFKEPKPAPKIEEFAAGGVRQVFYFSAAISADSLHSQIDVPELVAEARVPAGFPLVNLGAWNDDPLVIQAIKERIDRQMGRSNGGAAGEQTAGNE
jgi:sirohydrochlorin ferrochelatase